jgi:hypothetical protein
LKAYLRRTRLRILLLRIVVGRPPTLRTIQQAMKNQAG